MSTVLLAWELGAGIGHLARLRLVAEALLAAGHQVHLAAPSTSPVRACLAELGRLYPGRVTASPAPQLPSPPSPASLPPTRTLPDPLALFGFADPARLTVAVAGWHSWAASAGLASMLVVEIGSAWRAGAPRTRLA